MRILYLIVSLLLCGIGVLHMATTFRAYREFNASAIWFFGAGLLLMQIGALNLFCRRQATALPALRSFTFWCNLLVTGYIFCAGLATKATLAQMIILVGATLLATLLSRTLAATTR